MTQDDRKAALASLGVIPVDQERHPNLYADLFRVARRLRESQRQIVGLLPANDGTAITGIAVQLGFVLAEACDGMVALIDANTQAPGLASVASDQERAEARAGFATTWLEDFFALLTPVVEKRAGLALDQLEATLRQNSEGFAHVLVDLTGFERLGEHWGTFEAVHGVLVVGHPGRTSEREVYRLMREVPASRSLGFLLVG